LLLGLFFSSIPAFAAGQSVNLAWNPSSDHNAIGYKVYYGVASQTYTNMINVGNVTSANISGLVKGVTYYFAATSYSSTGSESPFSNEATYTVPTALFDIHIRNAPAGQFILTIAGQIGHTYEIQATQDFKTWTVIGTVLLGVVTLDFTDTNAKNFSRRFYRLRDVLP